MYKALPEIRESEEELKGLLMKEKDYRTKQRLQALYLLRTSQAKTRLEASRMLGVNRDTVGRWLSSYDRGGVSKLLDIHHPSGRQSSLPQEYKEQLKDRLSIPQGVSSYKELWMELRERYGIRITYQALHHYVRYKLKVPRKSHIKNPDLESSFRDNFTSIILSLLVSSGVDLSRARIFFEDETRIGLMVILRRVLTLMGVKPVSKFQHRFENFYVYGAVEPSTGERFFLELPYLSSEMFQIFIDEFSKKYGDTINIMVVDNGRYHIARALEIPSNIKLVFLPPYSPELNPIERLWQFIKDKLASIGVFKNLEEVEKRVEYILSRLTSSEVQSITGYKYITNTVNALSIF